MHLVLLPRSASSLVRGPGPLFISADYLFNSAGMCTSDERKRNEILRLIDLCRQRTGWPVNPMDEELKAIWDSSGAS
jgi:hypothetical protein